MSTKEVGSGEDSDNLENGGRTNPPRGPFANNIFEKLTENEEPFQLTAAPPSATTTKRFVDPAGNGNGRPETGNTRTTGSDEEERRPKNINDSNNNVASSNTLFGHATESEPVKTLDNNLIGSEEATTLNSQQEPRLQQQQENIRRGMSLKNTFTHCSNGFFT